MSRIVVCGYMIRHPVAGNLLAFFHYLLGLARLGHEVAYLEESGWPDACYDPGANDYGDDPAGGLRRVRELMAAHGVNAPVYYVRRDDGAVFGDGTWADVKRTLRGADVLLNVGGVCWLPEFRTCGRRALVDMDPLFTQLGRFGGEGMAEHHAYFTYGGNVGRPDCGVPTGAVDWRPTVPPVVPEIWSTLPPPPVDAPLTTVANWDAYGVVEHDGRQYGQKGQEFLRLRELPVLLRRRKVQRRLELATAGMPQDVAAGFNAAGWTLRDAGEVSADMGGYRAYIASSRGEFSAAKNAYVQSRSGWFSDRTVCYLAAGRPAVVQDTGFTEWLGAAEGGVLAFTDVHEAAACVERLEAEYPAHAVAAAALARRVFDYRVVLPRLLDVTTARPTAAAAAGVTRA